MNNKTKLLCIVLLCVILGLLVVIAYMYMPHSDTHTAIVNPVGDNLNIEIPIIDNLEVEETDEPIEVPIDEPEVSETETQEIESVSKEDEVYANSGIKEFMERNCKQIAEQGYTATSENTEDFITYYYYFNNTDYMIYVPVDTTNGEYRDFEGGNKHGSDYPNVLFTNGMPSDSVSFYNAVLESGQSVAELYDGFFSTSYTDGDDVVVFVNLATGAEYTYELR